MAKPPRHPRGGYVLAKTRNRSRLYRAEGERTDRAKAPARSAGASAAGQIVKNALIVLTDVNFLCIVMRIKDRQVATGMTLTEEIAALKAREKAVILAHYYAPDEVQAIADHVGDSFYLAKAAAATDAQTIVFCGVHFMGESAKILNPARRVLMPDLSADCAMAHMADASQIEALRGQVKDLAVVCYINSTAELKCLADVCVTSSNAVAIVRSLPQKNILFIPDQNLGGFVARQVPEKTFYFSGGYCPVHACLLAEDVLAEKRAHPHAAVAVHPECTPEVRAAADFVGSTAEIVGYARGRGEGEMIVGTEPGVLWALRRQCPRMTFYPVTPQCADMKRNTLEGVCGCLESGRGEIVMDEALMRGARISLERMLALAK